jgi:hypothetical protein
MIDLNTEKLLSHVETLAMLPGATPRKTIHRATLARWYDSGKLEFVKVGKFRFTTREAIARLAAKNGQPRNCQRGDAADTSEVATDGERIVV